MAVTIHVNGKSNSLVHKGSMGISKSTIPDVCKTPSPGGPVPIPYPVIVSMSSDLKKGSKKVKFDGGNSAAIKGSEFSRCTGDEPGTAGGVKSSTNMKEATWILYSFDVKIEGKNACRLSDKMMMNHGNTACLAGLQQFPILGEGIPELLVACAIYCCDQAEYTKIRHHTSTGKDGSKITGKSKDCRSLSTTKHSCVLHSLRKKDKSKKMTTTDKFPDVEASPRGTAPSPGGSSTVNIIPDIILYGDRIIDCKFPCPDGSTAPLKKKKCPSNPEISGREMMTPKERDVYPNMKERKIEDVAAWTPRDAESMIEDVSGKSADNFCDCKYEDA